MEGCVVRRGSCPPPSGPSAWRASPHCVPGSRLRVVLTHLTLHRGRLRRVSLLGDAGTTTLVQQLSQHQSWEKRIVFFPCPLSRSCCPERNFKSPGKGRKRFTIRSQLPFVTRTRGFGSAVSCLPLGS
uniref:Uncharacterized protein n=1 Tax=Cebus imitator TaxID=2715852 RepID=A0A2K5QBW3_CEBIM